MHLFECLLIKCNVVWGDPLNIKDSVKKLVSFESVLTGAREQKVFRIFNNTNK
jgi:hypothetical protein